MRGDPLGSRARPRAHHCDDPCRFGDPLSVETVQPRILEVAGAPSPAVVGHEVRGSLSLFRRKPGPTSQPAQCSLPISSLANPMGPCMSGRLPTLTGGYGSIK